MVVLLNAIWMLLSLIAGWLWLRRWRDVSGHSFVVQLCSLTCALIILFPVVSANDDLYVERTAIEISDKQKSSAVASFGKSPRQCNRVHATPYSSLQTHPVAPREAVEGTVATALVSLPTVVAFRLLLNRPPPPFVLA